MIAACLKWVEPRAADEALAATPPDARFAGLSASDQAALEWALRCRERSGEEVVALVAGPAAAERVLHDALAAGATRAVRVDLPFDEPSASVAAGLAEQLADAR